MGKHINAETQKGSKIFTAVYSDNEKSESEVLYGVLPELKPQTFPTRIPGALFSFLGSQFRVFCMKYLTVGILCELKLLSFYCKGNSLLSNQLNN